MSISPDEAKEALDHITYDMNASPEADQISAYIAQQRAIAELFAPGVDPVEAVGKVLVTLKNIADAPACSADGRLYYEMQSEDGQTGTMDVDPIAWIADASQKALSALATLSTPQPKGGG